MDKSLETLIKEHYKTSVDLLSSKGNAKRTPLERPPLEQERKSFYWDLLNSAIENMSNTEVKEILDYYDSMKAELDNAIEIINNEHTYIPTIKEDIGVYLVSYSLPYYVNCYYLPIEEAQNEIKNLLSNPERKRNKFNNERLIDDSSIDKTLEFLIRRHLKTSTLRRFYDNKPDKSYYTNKKIEKLTDAESLYLHLLETTFQKLSYEELQEVHNFYKQLRKRLKKDLEKSEQFFDAAYKHNIIEETDEDYSERIEYYDGIDHKLDCDLYYFNLTYEDNKYQFYYQPIDEIQHTINNRLRVLSRKNARTEIARMIEENHNSKIESEIPEDSTM